MRTGRQRWVRCQNHDNTDGNGATGDDNGDDDNNGDGGDDNGNDNNIGTSDGATGDDDGCVGHSRQRLMGAVVNHGRSIQQSAYRLS